MELIRRLEQVARSQYRVGGAQHADVVRAQVELGKLEDELRTLKALKQPIAAKLNAALGRPADADVPWPTQASPEAIDVTDQRVLAWLREASPELKALDAEIVNEELDLGDLLLDAFFVVGHGSPLRDCHFGRSRCEGGL